MSDVALVFSVSFIFLAMIISYWQDLKLEKDLAIGAVRAFVQLTAVGYVLKFIFDLAGWQYMIPMIVVMVLVAGKNAARRGEGLPGAFILVTLSIALAELVTMTMLVNLKIIPFTPRYVIPLSGMIIGNAMVASGLALNRLRGEIAARRAEILAALALGATSRQAVEPALKASVKAGMIPTVDAMKTVGLVQLPGMMTGQIIAGASPIEAVKYQILVQFMLSASVGLTSMLVCLLSYRKLFTPAYQLRSL
ncbi:MAG TPA: iron export ABC transporter permease subunit FetB [Firmicutes bacterium]|nr:iron export ABC transporter permease subunit FetB [Bacillota bacterium]